MLLSHNALIVELQYSVRQCWWPVCPSVCPSFCYVVIWVVLFRKISPFQAPKSAICPI